MNSPQLPSNLEKIREGVESALTFHQQDLGLLSTYYFEMLEEGWLDELDVYIAFKKMEKFIETILPYIKDKVDETKLVNAYKKHHVSLTTQNGRSFYDYSTCGEIFEKLESKKEEVKSLEKYLQTITKPTDLVDEETGEVTTIMPAIKKQGQSIILRYEK